MLKNFVKLIFVALVFLMPLTALADRVKDLATVLGVRDNQLLGYGLVVGLNGTGDQGSPVTLKSTISMLTQLGIPLPPETSLEMKNLASVLVTATLPPFARPGQTIDVTISSVGNAKSLLGGTLIMTPLKGADGQIYAMAQGNMLIGEPGAQIVDGKVQSGSAGGKPAASHLIVGRIPSGATVERAVPTAMGQGDYVLLTLNSSDFTTASRITDAINKQLSNGQDIAAALDGRAIRVRAPQGAARVAFMSRLENLEVEAAQAAARIIINARTGSIVMNQQVTLETCAVSHGNMTVVISPEQTKIVKNKNANTSPAENDTKELRSEPGNLMLLPKAVSLNDVIRALNAIGATPKDLLAILQAMKASGALRAELEII